MIYLERPWALALLALPVLFALLRSSGRLRGIAFPLTLGDWGGYHVEWRAPSTVILTKSAALCAFAGFVFACVSLSGPVRVRREAVYANPDANVVFALDVSPSMAARDMQGPGGREVSRLEAGKEAVRALVPRRPGTAFALVGLGSSAAALLPPTLDHETFLNRLSSLSIGEFGDGTALGLALALAAAHARTRADPAGTPAYVVLITDGENNAGEIHPETAAAALASRGIGLMVVGIGTKGSVPVDYVDPATGTRYSGVLESDFNESSLREIARAAGGSYSPASDAESLGATFDAIDSAVPAGPPAWTRSIEESLSYRYLVAAFLSLSAAWIIRRMLLGAVV